MNYLHQTKEMEKLLAICNYPYLEMQLQAFKYYEKIFHDPHSQQYIYIKDMIGLMELKLALAKALIVSR